MITLSTSVEMKFRRYEDSSLVYTGINKHSGEKVGLFDTSIDEFELLEQKQEKSMIEQ